MAKKAKAIQLNLTFDKGADKLNFRVYAKDEKGRKVMIDGFVGRGFDTFRYYVEGIAYPMGFTPEEGWDFFGPKENSYNEWYENGAYGNGGNGYKTIKEGLVEHLTQQWGIQVTEEMVEDQMPEMPKEVLKAAEEIVYGWLMHEEFNGTKKEHEEFAKNAAAEIVYDGTCFDEQGWEFPCTTNVGLYNLNGETVGEEWEYKVQDAA